MPNNQNAMTDDHHWMRIAIELAHQCPPAERAYSVGSVIVDEAGNEIARGYSRDTDSKVHAEESALSKIDLRSTRKTRGSRPRRFTPPWNPAQSALPGRRAAHS